MELEIIRAFALVHECVLMLNREPYSKPVNFRERFTNYLWARQVFAPEHLDEGDYLLDIDVKRKNSIMRKLKALDKLLE